MRPRKNKRQRLPHGTQHRYKHKDDFGTLETTFLIYAFWYVEALACASQVEEVVKAFENNRAIQQPPGAV